MKIEDFYSDEELAIYSIICVNKEIENFYHKNKPEADMGLELLVWTPSYMAEYTISHKYENAIFIKYIHSGLYDCAIMLKNKAYDSRWYPICKKNIILNKHLIKKSINSCFYIECFFIDCYKDLDIIGEKIGSFINEKIKEYRNNSNLFPTVSITFPKSVKKEVIKSIEKSIKHKKSRTNFYTNNLTKIYINIGNIRGAIEKERASRYVIPLTKEIDENDDNIFLDLNGINREEILNYKIKELNREIKKENNKMKNLIEGK